MNEFASNAVVRRLTKTFESLGVVGQYVAILMGWHTRIAFGFVAYTFVMKN